MSAYPVLDGFPSFKERCRNIAERECTDSRSCSCSGCSFGSRIARAKGTCVFNSRSPTGVN